MRDNDSLLRGVIPSLVVPLRENEIAWEGLHHDFGLCSEQPVDALGLGGGLGELAGMDAKSFAEVCGFVRERVHVPRLLRVGRALDHPSGCFARIRSPLSLQGRPTGEAHSPFHFTNPGTADEVSRALVQEWIECNARL